MSVSHIIFNTFIAFIVIYMLSRILGKKLISQMTFFDVVAGVSLGSLVGSVILVADIPVWKGSISLIVFAAISFLVDYTSLKSYRGRKILNDVPTPIIKEGKILVEGLKKVRLTIDDLLFQLRKKDIFYLDEVDYAFLETDGTISALKKSEKLTPTISDLQLNTISRGLPQTFIIDGNILPSILTKIGKNEIWVKEILEQNKINSVKDILVAQIDNQMKVYVSLKNQ
ncbi:MAG: DUF421 domain-containing protein, partial [Bacillota bacterium]|nr:DUF421 domain-containing protein [Bacillota bacterium]